MEFESKYGLCPFVSKKNRLISSAYDVELQNCNLYLKPMNELL